MNEPGSAIQARITAFWDEVAANYETPDNVAHPGTPGYANWVEVLRSLLPDPRAQVLDVGTGTGFVARIAVELGHDVTGIDLSEAMLRSSSIACQVGQLLQLAVGDAVDPPFSPASFDVVVSRSLLWTLREPQQAFLNWYRLLRPGGRAIVIYGLASNTTASASSDDTPAVEPNLFTSHYTPNTQTALTAMYLPDHEPVLQLAVRAGFENIRVDPLEIVHGWETSPGSDLPYALVGYRGDGNRR